MTSPTQDAPRKRFTPIPVETTFERFRVTGPAPELTPSPSPRETTPAPRQKRRFAPQLVESSVRRSRRIGDEGPATRHTDRTDITPYTKHIYSIRTKRRHGSSATPTSQVGHARRESCDDEIAGGVFDLMARDAQNKLQEVFLSAFPNSDNNRIGGAEHFYVRDGSDDDSLPSRCRPGFREPGTHRLPRRNSSKEDISWAFKEAQDHAQTQNAIRERTRERISTLELDNMSIEGPPSDAMGLTRDARHSLSGSPFWTRYGSIGPIGEFQMPLIYPESSLPTIGELGTTPPPRESPPLRPIGERVMPYIPSGPTWRAAHMPYAPASQIPQESGFHAQAPFRRMPQDRDMSLERVRNFHRLKARHSPPMLGKDLSFRTCSSPKQTKLEPDRSWDLETGANAKELNRDTSEQHGLWRGYCYTSNKNEQLVPLGRPAMMITPVLPGTPMDHNAKMDFETPAPTITEEPSPTNGNTRNGTSVLSSPRLALLLATDRRPFRSQEPKGLHMLQGLDEKLRKEKAAAERGEQVAAEFSDTFITQVYNYLSLGYPSMARPFDEELSKISRISVEELEKDDAMIMAHMWCEDDACRDEDGADCKTGEKKKAKGHIRIDTEEKEGTNEEDRCPRWKALKLYIHEWARQHPDLNAISPLAWGVRERRGSWGL